jgi:hypothetical protein
MILRELWICLIYARLKELSLTYIFSIQYSHVHMLEYVYYKIDLSLFPCETDFEV